MDHYYQDIDGWFDYQDLFSQVIRRHLLPTPARIVEVGCYKGKSTAHLLVELEKTRLPFHLTCVDGWDHPDLADIIDWPVPEAVFRHNISPSLNRLNSGFQRFDTIKDLSVNAAKQIADASLDFCFIDACHDYDNVRADIDAWLPKMKPNSIIAGHDFIPHFDGLMKAVRETWNHGVRIHNTCWYVVLEDGQPKVW